MDISFVGLRDRRVAASNEITSVAAAAIYGRGSAARTGGAAQARRTDREPKTIRAIILHQTGSPVTFLAGTRQAPPGAGTDRDVASDHRIDRITAHFVVLQDGSVFYTHDVEYILNDAGGRLGIDIEFAGRFGSDTAPAAAGRLTKQAIRAGRKLVSALKQAIPSITHIHPHGQVQTRDRQGRCGGPGSANVADKLHSCSGPDVWVNVGEWAAMPGAALGRGGPARGGLNLVCDSTLPGYQNNTISARQRNLAYDQRVVGF